MLITADDGDGRNDVITALNAHGWGLSWFAQARDAHGGITFKEFVFLTQRK